MNSDNKILILNTGGTFNKIYNQINGELYVPISNNSITQIIENSKITNTSTAGIIYKDSLEINKKDRIELKKYIQNSTFNKIIIVHGTDTMTKTASFLAKHIKNKQIVLTGSMVPFSINKIEAVSNLMIAYGFLYSCKRNNIYISMHGLVKKHTKIKKNKKLGIFECL